MSAPDLSAWVPPAADGAALLDDVAEALRRFVAFPSEAAAVAAALWTAHAHAVDALDSSPRLALLSPEPGSGKTRTLEVLELLVPQLLAALNASAPAIFRTIEKDRPTLLLDEVDTIFGRRASGDDPAADLRGLLNSGHRKGASIPRCVGPSYEVRKFPTYCAVALAGLGDLPDTLMSRSVIVRMRRRAPGEHVEAFRRREVADDLDKLRNRLADWAGAVAADLAQAYPTMPAGVTDRDADCWEPLLAIADAAGGHWPALGREACVEMVKVTVSREASLGVRLLADLRDVFGERDRMSTDAILAALCDIDEAPWSDLRGKRLDARGLAYRLRQYGVHSHQFKIADDRKVRGYSIPGSETGAGGLYDAFIRYLPARSGTGGTSGTAQVTGHDQVPDAEVGTGTAEPSGTHSAPVTCGVPPVTDVPVPAEDATTPPLDPGWTAATPADCVRCGGPTMRYGANDTEPICGKCAMAGAS